MRWLLEFDQIHAGMLAEVGGKAANLGELTRAGLPVPPGFCVTTEAYRELAGTEHTKARDLLMTAAIPAEIAEQIAAGYARLGDNVPVAVRSSATAEDLPFASFAGQQDTYLNVVGEVALLDAVRRCWASLWTDRAVAYRATNGIDDATVQLAVVVQLMVQSAVAGVLFTANPVTGRRAEAVIDASPGLGEAVVSGAVNPDHFVVDTASGEIRERRLGDKRLAVRSLPGGGTEQVASASGADEPCLTDEQIRALAALGRRVEDHYGSPQDTEWAIDDDGVLWLTQARPITTLYPLPDHVSTSDIRVYFSFSVAQGLFRPMTPMGIAAFRLLASSASRLFGYPVADPESGPPMFVEAGQRVFADATAVVRSPVGRAIAPKVLGVMEARSAKILQGLFDDPRFALTTTSRWPFLRRAIPTALRNGVPTQFLHAALSPRRAHRTVERLAASLQAKATLAEPATPAQRLAHAEKLLLESTVPLAPRVFPIAAAGFALLWLGGRLLGDRLEPGELQEVLRGLPHNVTTEMDLELWQLASTIRADRDATALLLTEPAADLARRYHEGTLPGVVGTGLVKFLGQYGHRAVAEIDLGMPRWSDDPTHILGVLANYLRLDDPALAPDTQFARGAAAAEATIDRLAARASGLRARLVRSALRRARLLAGVREMPKYFIVLALAEARRQLAAVGAELAAAGRIATPADVFFLDFKQTRAALSGKDSHELVAQRRASYDLELRRRRLARVMLSDGTEPEALATAADQADGALAGTPASAGTVTGTARVVLDPVGAHLEPGEILVAPSTDPGWTPLFLTAGGLVMEMGGANSHGAVVAREYGIPAVVGVPDATHLITSGQQLTINGATGTVIAHPAT